jgi:hypothetical protein
MPKNKHTNYDTHLHNLGLSLRRLLYLNQIQIATIDWIKANPICQPWIKNVLNNQVNAMNHFENKLKQLDNSGAWQPIQSDLLNDRIHDISLHMDVISKVNEVAEITAVVEQYINEQLKNNQHAEK